MKNRLEEIRKEKGIKQEQLAAALEVSRQTIGSLENGRYNSIKLSKSSAEKLKLEEIKRRDERNILISKNAGSVTAAAALFVFVGLSVVFCCWITKCRHLYPLGQCMCRQVFFSRQPLIIRKNYKEKAC